MSEFAEALGGLGVFLLGVVIMTSGLKGIAGDALRAALTRFTRSPLSGACTGAASTAILQSSSATTVAAVGFVGAGLLSFPQALGIIFGANVGTTITGWLVALIGFKLQLGSVVLPFILLGVLMQLFGKGRTQQAGLALAGFGLIFVGIATMQDGMSSMQGRVTPQSFPSDSISGRFKLVLIGVAITLVTQSSSAGVAAALTALHTGTVSFEQAAALVIGMDVGTTATAMLATMGGAAETRRTGYSHVVYNLLTGVSAFALLTPYVWLWNWLAPGQLANQSEFALVGFHTSFNLLGVIVIVPLAHPFAALMTRLVPDSRTNLARRLDKHLLSDPFIALEAVRATQVEIYCDQLYLTNVQLQSDPRHDPERLSKLEVALDLTQGFLDQIHSKPERSREWQLLMACIHAQDHMNRLNHRLHEGKLAAMAMHNTALLVWRDQLAALCQKQSSLTLPWNTAAHQAGEQFVQLKDSTRKIRQQLMRDVASGRIEADDGEKQLDATRWLARVGHHQWRINHYMQLAEEASHHTTGAIEASTPNPLKV